VLLARGLSDLLAQLALSTSSDGRALSGGYATPLAQIVVGLALFLGARALAGMWQSLRPAERSSGHDRDAS
jgi:hypothetical protein